MITVHIAGHLGNYTGRRVDIEIPSVEDISELITRLCERFLLIRDGILGEDERTRQYINVFVNEDNVRNLQSEKTKPRDGDDIYTLSSVSGGAPISSSVIL